MLITGKAVHVWGQGVHETSLLSSLQFCCESKNFLKNKLLKKSIHMHKASNTCLAYRKCLFNISCILSTDDRAHFKHHLAVCPPSGIYPVCFLTIKGSGAENHEPRSEIPPLLIGNYYCLVIIIVFMMILTTANRY